MNRTLPSSSPPRSRWRAAARRRRRSRRSSEAKRPDAEFLHSIHVDQGIECTDCHAGHREGDLAHASGTSRTSEKCEECHEGYDRAEARAAPAPRLNFSHAQHLGQTAVKDKCDTCHKKLPEMGEPRCVAADGHVHRAATSTRSTSTRAAAAPATST